MLKTSKIALAGAIAAAAMVSTGAHAATVSATAEVDILAPVTLVQSAGLDFGVVGGAVAGTVTIGTGADTASCSVGLMCAGTSRRGAFNVTGASGYTVTITVDAATTLDDAGAGAPMALSLTPSTTSVVGAGATLVPFHVGGVLSINAAQAAGTYTGNYNVSADYQ